MQLPEVVTVYSTFLYVFVQPLEIGQSPTDTSMHGTSLRRPWRDVHCTLVSCMHGLSQEAAITTPAVQALLLTDRTIIAYDRSADTLSICLPAS